MSVGGEQIAQHRLLICTFHPPCAPWAAAAPPAPCRQQPLQRSMLRPLKQPWYGLWKPLGGQRHSETRADERLMANATQRACSGLAPGASEKPFRPEPVAKERATAHAFRRGSNAWVQVDVLAPQRQVPSIIPARNFRASLSPLSSLAAGCPHLPCDLT